MRPKMLFTVLWVTMLATSDVAAQTADHSPRPDEHATPSQPTETSEPTDASEADRAALQRRIETLLARQRELEQRLDGMIDRQRNDEPGPGDEANHHSRRTTDRRESRGIRYAEGETAPAHHRQSYDPGYDADRAPHPRPRQTPRDDTGSTGPTPTNLSIDRSPRYSTGNYTQPIEPARTTGPLIHQRTTNHFYHGVYRPGYRYHTGYHRPYRYSRTIRSHHSYHPGTHYRKYYYGRHHGKYHRGHQVGLSVGGSTGNVGWRYSTGYHHSTRHDNRHSGLRIHIK